MSAALILQAVTHRFAFKEVVQHGTRSDAGESMPAHALFLWSVEYGNGTA